MKNTTNNPMKIDMPNYINILQSELKWLELMFIIRMYDSSVVLSEYTSKEITENYNDLLASQNIEYTEAFPPKPEPTISMYSNLIVTNSLSFDERLLLALAIAPHLQPDFLFTMFHRQLPQGKSLYKINETGGIQGENYRGIIPTGLTFLYIAAGNNFFKRLQTLQLLMAKNSILFTQNIIDLPINTQNDPVASTPITIHQAYLQVLVTNELKYK